MERFNPYLDLKEKFRNFAAECEYRHDKTMFTYRKAELNKDWSFEQLYERVAAADQLGYDVGLFATSEGLVVKYLKKLPSRPWEIR